MVTPLLSRFLPNVQQVASYQAGIKDWYGFIGWKRCAANPSPNRPYVDIG